METKIPIEVSARHVHLSKEDFEKLFGKRKKLKRLKDLSQPGEFASEETVTLINDKKEIGNVRVLGPFRENSQVEISLTDAYSLKLNPIPKIRISGDLDNAVLIAVKGEKSLVAIPCIIAQRHLHCSLEEAKKLKLKNKEKISIKVEGIRETTFHNVAVRTSDKFRLAVHLDTDEGNSAGITGKTFGEIVKMITFTKFI